jgi:hypothetical protein
MDDFTPTDAWVVDHAMVSAEDKARERQEKMPSSAQALQEIARALYAVREKILDRLPPEARRAYPPRGGRG